MLTEPLHRPHVICSAGSGIRPVFRKNDELLTSVPSWIPAHEQQPPSTLEPDTITYNYHVRRARPLMQQRDIPARSYSAYECEIREMPKIPLPHFMYARPRTLLTGRRVYVGRQLSGISLPPVNFANTGLVRQTVRPWNNGHLGDRKRGGSGTTGFQMWSKCLKTHSSLLSRTLTSWGVLVGRRHRTAVTTKR